MIEYRQNPDKFPRSEDGAVMMNLAMQKLTRKTGDDHSFLISATEHNYLGQMLDKGEFPVKPYSHEDKHRPVYVAYGTFTPNPQATLAEVMDLFSFIKSGNDGFLFCYMDHGSCTFRELAVYGLEVVAKSIPTQYCPVHDQVHSCRPKKDHGKTQKFAIAMAVCLDEDVKIDSFRYENGIVLDIFLRHGNLDPATDLLNRVGIFCLTENSGTIAHNRLDSFSETIDRNRVIEIASSTP